MTCMPANQKVYHITHVRNLSQMVQAGVIWSDARRIELGLDCEIVGMRKIKYRRLYEIEVGCHPGTKVGEYTPFYFCPRSIMLYILHMGNHPDITYGEGQEPIVHLQADLKNTVKWADRHGVNWAFSDRNAGTYVAKFYNSLDDFDRINWRAVASTDFRSMMVREGKQAEFLMHGSFPWELVEMIGVKDASMVDPVRHTISQTGHQPPVSVKRQWYY